MKKSSKFWVGTTLILYILIWFTGYFPVIVTIHVILGFIALVLIIGALVWDVEKSSDTIAEDYEFNWRINIVYWVRRINNYLDNEKYVWQ